MPVERSDLITTLQEARDYYRANLVGVRKVTCHDKRVKITFPYEMVHLYSEAPDRPIRPGDDVVSQPTCLGRFETRLFSVERARLMDAVLPAISNFTVSIAGNGQGERRVLHGQMLATGDYMRVVLRKGPGDAWTCVSAFPVPSGKWLEAMRSARAKFPPE